MNATVLYIHSILRYFVLLLLLVVIVKSLIGMAGNKTYGKSDNQFSLFLLITTHLQLVVGLLLYALSPHVQFSSSTMKDAVTRYWTVEHSFMMILAVALITIGRITHKKMATDLSKFKRLFILNTVALVIVLTAIIMSGRGLFGSSMF